MTNAHAQETVIVIVPVSVLVLVPVFWRRWSGTVYQYEEDSLLLLVLVLVL